MRFRARGRSSPEEKRVATHFPSLRSHGEVNSNVFMFVQDVHAGVMPVRAIARESSNYKVEILGDENEKNKTVILLESLARYDRYNLEELVSDAFNDVVLNLSHEGRATYEIRCNESDNGSVYLLHGFTSRRLFHLFNKFIQIVPEKDRQLWNKAYFVIPENDIWLVSIPDSLGGVSGYRSVLRKLKKFDHLGPKFWREDLEHQRKMSEFNFQQYVRETEIYYYRITKLWGWNRRDYTQKNWTEFMQLYRTLRFKWAQATLREHVTLQFNKLLKRLGIDAQIRITGIPTAADILRIRNQMYDGSISFDKAYKATSF